MAEQLQHALDARVVIEQAKGVLVAREGLTEREAFERLRRQARRQRRPVAEVAAEVMATAHRPARDGGKRGPVGQSDDRSSDSS